MNPTVQRLRAEVESDRKAWRARVEEVRGLDLCKADAAILARAAVALHHGYGAIESALGRVARLIEGSVPSGRDWHVALLEAVALDIEGVRPRVLSDDSLRGLRSLLAFRHFFRQAYAVDLEAPRLDALRGEMLALHAPLERDLDALDAHLALVASEPAGL